MVAMGVRWAVGLAVVLLACDPGTDNRNVGFMVGDSGEIVVLTCRGVEPERVAVWDSDDPVLGDREDELLEAVSPGDYSVGGLGLLRAVMDTEFDGAEVSADPGGAVLLNAGQLSAGEVLYTDGAVVTVETFRNAIAEEEKCRLDLE